jgi:hypothetical protein
MRGKCEHCLMLVRRSQAHFSTSHPMHSIFARSIRDIGWPEGYSIECTIPESCESLQEYLYLPNRNSWGKPFASPHEYEHAQWEYFEAEIAPRVQEGVQIHLNGVISPRVFEYARNWYKRGGWYDELYRTYRVTSASFTLGVDFVNLVYYPWHTLEPSQIRAIIAALNDGIIRRIFAQPGQDEYFERYLSQSHIHLCHLAEGLSVGWGEKGTRSFTLTAKGPSWIEAPLE